MRYSELEEATVDRMHVFRTNKDDNHLLLKSRMTKSSYSSLNFFLFPSSIRFCFTHALPVSLNALCNCSFPRSLRDDTLMAFVSQLPVLPDMESDPEHPSPPINRYAARQSRLWMPGSTEAMNVQPPGRRLSTSRRASKSTRTNTFEPSVDKCEPKQKAPVLG